MTENQLVSAEPSKAGPPRERGIFRRFWYFLRRRVFHAASTFLAFTTKLMYALEKVFEFLYDSTIGTILRLLDRILKSKLWGFLARNTKWVVIVIAVVGLVYVIVRETIFTIGFDFDGVIVRLGAYHRTVTPGVNFKIPVIERLYVVNTEDRRQANFGFVQFTPPGPASTEFEQDQRDEEQELLAEREAVEAADGQFGDFMGQQARLGPRLPRDYIFESELTNRDELDRSDEEDEVRERLEAQLEANELIIPPNGKVPVPAEMKMITGDLGIVYMTYAVQYEIVRPEHYLFNSIDVLENIRDLSEAGMRIAVGDRQFEGALSSDRQAIEREAETRIQEIVDRYRLGIDIVNVLIQDSNPPDQVKEAFHRVISAKQQMENTIHQAESEYNSVIPQLQGKAERILTEAQGYSVNLRAKAVGEAARFDLVHSEYIKSPTVVRSRYYLETLEELHLDMAFTLVDPQLKGILPVFNKSTQVGDSTLLGAGAQHSLDTSAPPLQEGQRQIRNRNVTEYGVDGMPFRGVDPITTSSQAAEQNAAQGSALPELDRPPITGVQPVQVEEPRPSP